MIWFDYFILFINCFPVSYAQRTSKKIFKVFHGLLFFKDLFDYLKIVLKKYKIRR